MYSVPSTGEGVCLVKRGDVMTDTSKVAEALSPYIGRMDLDLDTFFDLNSLGETHHSTSAFTENTTF